jgi:HEAT repeat protein
MLLRSITTSLFPPRTGLLVGMLSVGLFASGCGSKEPAAPQEEAAEEAAAVPEESGEPLEKELSESGSDKELISMIDAAAEKRGAGKEMLEQIVGATESDQADVRWHAARAIGMIGEDAIAEMPTLIRLLSDDDAVVVAQAAAAIGEIRKDDHRQAADLDDAAKSAYGDAVEALAGKIVHPDARVRRVSIRSLAALQPPTDMLVPLFAQQLSDEDPSVVIPALHTMADVGAAAVPFLIESLAEPKSRYWASVVLAEIGSEAGEAVEALTEIANDADGEPEERMQAILALAAIGEDAAPAGDSLAALASSESGPVQYAAVYACGMLRVAAATESLEAIASTDVPFLPGIATWALARIHPEDPAHLASAYEDLMTGTENENPAVRQASVTGLSDLEDELSEEQRSALAAALTGTLDDDAPAVREAGAAALVRLGGDAVPALVVLLGENGDAQMVGLELLAAIGPAAADSFGSVLDTLLASDDMLVKAEAAFALGAIARADGDAASALDAASVEKAIGPLVELMSNDSVPLEVRGTAAYALGKFGTAAASAAETVRTLSTSDDELLATVATWAGLRIEPGNRELYEQAIPLLEKALRSERELARLEAAVALGEIGGDAAGSVPLLELVSEDDPVRAVREAAANAIKQIGSGS